MRRDLREESRDGNLFWFFFSVDTNAWTLFCQMHGHRSCLPPGEGLFCIFFVKTNGSRTVAKPGTKSCGVKLPIYQGPIPKYLKIEGVLQKSCGVS
jgi:hypothetical protein